MWAETFENPWDWRNRNRCGTSPQTVMMATRKTNDLKLFITGRDAQCDER
jgi:hypothetical protein